MLNQLQRLGKVLIFPIAVLPFAAILNRLGAIGLDPTIATQYSVGYWIGFVINAPGAAVFNNLPLIFAVGVAFGLAKDNRGEAALVGTLAFLILSVFLGDKGISWLMYRNVLTTTGRVTDPATGGLVDSDLFSRLLYILKTSYDGTKGTTSLAYQLDTGVFGGITVGILSAVCYNKFSSIILPDYLAFFGGRRFVPMIVGLVMVPVAFLFAVVWPWCQFGLSEMGTWIGGTKGAAPAAATLYGVVNRILQPFGLHHILNTFLWFQLPINGKSLTDISQFGYDGAPNQMVNGDINAFAQGIVGSGIWQSGFFPMFLGGLPGTAAAMWYCAKKIKRKETFVFLAGVAFVAFLTGIDEPLAFAFIFAAPLLWVVHAIFTGIISGITVAMGIKLGFGFSAGFIDYAISFYRSWQMATYSAKVSWAPTWLANPLWVFPLAIAAFGTYFGTFTLLINKFNIMTPGRNDDEVKTQLANTKLKGNAKYDLLATEIISAIGVDNIRELGNCTTRLRMDLLDNTKIDEQRIKAAGAYNIIKLNTHATQIVIGNDVEHVADRMKDLIVQTKENPDVKTIKTKITDTKT
ncbi:PTS transporter subunit EIIC [Spiroplasma endosymbiont of Virgichneumon dumeticola]|uniref:PTS transporter subunit EIIC n=1 Tax=Spiroplasma endosymbiont of Virgichneumon dumeticola TaxID=3139323 RepID=UPI0035C90F7E